ncbi:MAG TPA: M23 family metallopeptidase [Gemmataceae bacterium]|nr:M23 family metallopeptidase [Gemmataceae bacterium]
MPVDPIKFLTQGSKRRGLDPRAVLSVARTEGLGGGIGDQGTSFGPFQLHYGGAYPSHAPRGQQASHAWAWSPQGLNYALDKIAGVAGGLQGKQAINAIVSKFERPGNPAAEIGKALAYYQGQGGFSTGATMQPYETAGSLRAGAQAPLGNPHRFRDYAMSMMQNQDPNTFSIEGMLGAIMQLRNDRAKRSTVADPFANAATTRGGGGATSTDWFSGGDIIARAADHAKRALGNWQSDNALDIAAPVGTPVYAPEAGVLGNTGYITNPQDTGILAGQRINLQGSNNAFFFQHLSKLAKGIASGAHVTKGQLLGYTGRANNVDHLHFAVQRGKPGWWYGS